MSKLVECIGEGEVKKFVDGFVDAFEDMFDCIVCAIDIGACCVDGGSVKITMKKEI